jgi:hypothetical protein
MNDDLLLLANAYLDGELSTDERARAEADPDVMSEVDQLLALQAAVRDVDRPSAAVREAAIAAAMAEFAAVSAPTQPVVTAVRFERRPLVARYLSLAAAIVVIGVLGVVVATGLRTGDDADSTASEPVAVQPSVLGGDAESESRLTEAVAGDMANDMANDDVTGGSAAPEAELAPVNSAQAAQDVAPAAERPIIDPSLPLATPDELGSFGTYLLELEAGGDLPATPNTDCPQQEILGSTQYLFDGLPTDILVAVDTTDGTVTGVDPDTCEALVVGPLF